MLEIFATTRRQPGRTANEDDFLFGMLPLSHAAICDGAGDADGAACKALRLFRRLLADADLDDLGKTETWLGWIPLLDSHLIGTGESTFVACAVIENRILGCFVGDSRAFIHRAEDGETLLLTDSSSKARLGTGRAKGREFGCPFQPGDQLFLMTDGAWTPFDNPERLGSLLTTKSTMPRHRIPEAILEEAARTGHEDDMTVVGVFA